MKKFILKSMGCKSNQFEGSIIEENLINNGFEKVNDLKDADLFILNSCTVTHKSDNEAFYLLRNAKHINSSIKTLITGCIAQVEKDKLLENKFIDYVLGNDEKLNIADFLKTTKKMLVNNIMTLSKFHNIKLIDTTKTRANLKIQDGCDNRCTYCIIPFARGKSRSANVEFIINQIKSFEKTGFKEIVFTGIHIGQWGKENNQSILDLLKQVEISTNIRYRLGSLNPLEITDELLIFLAKSKNFCPHFHLSLQSACNNTLKRMNRFYKVEDYLKLIETINKKFNLPFIGSDIIAGFVGESDNDFQITLENLKKSDLTAIHTFPYSVRKGTLAETIEGHLSDDVKEQRANLIKQISKEKTDKFLQKNLGTVHSILIEKHLDKHFSLLKGLSKNYITILLNSSDLKLTNTIQQVKITEIKDNRVFGELI